MNFYVVDAFTDRLFCGNEAGVVLLGEAEPFPAPCVMQNVAAELRHSETAFVKAADAHTFELRYFTPQGEVDLCGHATVSAFTVLRDEKSLACGDYFARTLAGRLRVFVEPERIFLEMAPGKLLPELSDAQSTEVYEAYGLSLRDCPIELRPALVSTGLLDILLPVDSREKLDGALMNREKVIRLSKRYDAVGVHMFCFTQLSDATAYCRNFAPRYGIDEEAATGTSNGALTWLLHKKGLIDENGEKLFVQGEKMGRPSRIRSKILPDGAILVGGGAVISIAGKIRL